MIGLLLISHGEMASGLLDAAKLIVGEQENVAVIALREMDAIDALDQKIEQAVADLDQGQGVLILVDLFGASPFNASARVAMRMPNVDVITGMNLPMLLETTMNREMSELNDLINIAKNAGSDGVRVLKEMMDNQTD